MRILSVADNFASEEQVVAQVFRIPQRQVSGLQGPSEALCGPLNGLSGLVHDRPIGFRRQVLALRQLFPGASDDLTVQMRLAAFSTHSGETTQMACKQSGEPFRSPAPSSALWAL